MKKAKVLTKLLSMVLCLVMMFYVIPTSVYAEVSDALNSEEASSDTALAPSGTERDIYEVKELREENVKVFRLEDGSFMAASYASAVHYSDESGEWQDIDNSLSSGLSRIDTGDSRVKFVKKITGNRNIFTLKEDDTKLTMGLSGAIKKTAGEIIETTAEEPEDKLGKMTTLEKLSGKILYADILDGVDVEYVLTGRSIKENIIVKERKDSYSYTFTLALHGLTAHLTESGDIELRLSDGSVKYEIPAPVVYDSDNVYAPGENSAFSLETVKEGEYTLTVTVDSEWMNAAERAFPVTVDPTVKAEVVVDNNEKPYIDTYINANAPNIKHNNQYLYVSSTKTSYWKMSNLDFIPERAYISEANFNIRPLSCSGHYIGVFKVTSAWDEELTYSDTISSASPKGTISANASSFKDFSYLGTNNYLSFNITDIVKDWVKTPSSNYGIALKQIGNNPNSSTMFYSNDTSTIYVPTLTVRYTNMLGVEDYFPMLSHSLGDKVSGAVNLATGNLALSIATLSTTDSLMPFTATLTYNSTMSALFFNYGNNQSVFPTAATSVGFNWNMRQSVVKKTYTDSENNPQEMYIWADGDGTEHYFSLIDGEYRDEDGMLLILEENNDDSTVTITSTDGSVITFSNVGVPDREKAEDGWIISKITDKVGNELSFTFNDELKPQGVYLDPNDEAEDKTQMLKFNYPYDVPTYIYNPNTKEGIVFKYSGTYNGEINAGSGWYLREIIYAYVSDEGDLADLYDGTENVGVAITDRIRFTYASNGTLTEVEDVISESKIKYTYTSKSVSSVTEYGANDTEGNSIAFTYGNGIAKTTTIGTDYDWYDDIITTYTLDSLGRCVTSYSCDRGGEVLYGATTGIYETQENIKNNIKKSVTVGGSKANYILNGGFEKETNGVFDHWIESGTVERENSYGTDSFDGGYKAKLRPNRESSASISQYLCLEPGYYTISFDLDTNESKGINVIFRLTVLSDSSDICVEYFSLDEKNVNLNGDRVSASFSLMYASDEIAVRISIEAVDNYSEEENASVYIDHVMLEDGTSASPYNMVTMGGFENSAIDSEENTTVTPANAWTVIGQRRYETHDANNVFGNIGKLFSSVSSEKKMTQRIFTDEDGSGTGYEYIVAGYGISACPINDGISKFGIEVNVGYVGGAVVTYFYPFSSHNSSWQFVSGTFSTLPPPEKQEAGKVYERVEYIDLSCVYSYQPNSYGLFDSISVTAVKDETVEYSYYKNGAVRAAKNKIRQTFYEYESDANGEAIAFDVLRKANNNGEIYDYTYNANGMIESETYYTFVNNITHSHYYPAGYDNPDNYITKTAVRRTNYTYNSYGQCIQTDTYTEFVVPSEKIEGSDAKQVIDTTATGTAKHIISKNTYSDEPVIAGALILEEDSLGRKIQYFYDTDKCRLVATVNVSSGEGTCYVYDNKGRLINVYPAETILNSYTPTLYEENVFYDYNDRDQLSMIQTGSTIYTFTYDAFGNTTSVNTGDDSLATYEYEEKNGMLKKVIYSNGHIERYVYDDLDRISQIWYTKNGYEYKAYSYEYTTNGNISKIIDHRNSKVTVYTYSASGRLESITESATGMYAPNDYNVSFVYDNEGKLSSKTLRAPYHYYDSENYTYNIKDAQAKTTYLYSSDGKLIREKVDTNTKDLTVSYNYDSYDRLSGKTNNYTSFTGTEAYTYVTSGNNTSGEIHTYTTTMGSDSTTYTYEYDQNGNITKIVYSTGKEIRYEYDDLGQIIREDNELLGLTGYTYIYTYDNAGNITSAKRYALTAKGVTPGGTCDEEAYGYSGRPWGDRLTSYKGHAITYDAIGNPLAYYNGYNYTFTWQGRELTGVTIGSSTYSLGYNDEGIRTTKTVNGYKTHYYYNGNILDAEDRSGETFQYIYDASGSPLGFRYHDSNTDANEWETYWYEKNIQGDVVAVYSETGIKLLSYTYDAWGNYSRTLHNGGASTNAGKNPFLYRGYYYDYDLRLYYLGARYYDSNLRRFISPDALEYLGANGDLNSYNLYAYCSNNPVMYTDPSGHGILSAIVIALIVIAAAATANDIYQIANGDVEVDKEKTTENNVNIRNSYKILTPWMRMGYSFYLNHINEYTKNVITGSTSGVQYEWELHNFAYYCGIGRNSSKSVDIASTLFSDGNVHPLHDAYGNISSMGIMSVGMRASYIIFGNPLAWIFDLIENGGF